MSEEKMGIMPQINRNEQLLPKDGGRKSLKCTATKLSENEEKVYCQTELRNNTDDLTKLTKGQHIYEKVR